MSSHSNHRAGVTNRFRPFFVLALAVTLAGEARADFTNTSANFSLGFGFVGPTTATSTWNTNETSAANTATTLGDFTFVPTVTGPPFSGSGPTFTNRVLGNGTYDITKSGFSSNFLVSLTGTFSGTLPIWSENVKIILNVTEISLYGLKIHGFGTSTMQFQETTPGHTSSSSSITLNDVSGAQNPPPTPFAVASNWKQLVWNPADFAVNGTNSTRTFNLGSFTATQGYGIDGFEIEGNVIVTYIPEPSSLLLLGVAAVLLQWRKRQDG